MAKGTITGDEVLLGVVERVKETDAEFKKLLGTYNELQKAIGNTSNLSGLNNLLKQKNDADQKQIQIIKTVTNLEKQKNQIQRTSAGATRTNLNALKQLNNFYFQQSRLLNDLRNKYKALEARKQLGIKLTKAEAAEYTRLRTRVLALDSALKKTDAAAGQFQRNVGNYAKGARLLISSLRSLAGAFGFTSGIFLFASALKGAFNRVREFDKSMQNLAGILRTTRKDIKPIEDEIIKVAGASIKTSREVAELAESLATLGKRGQELKDLIKPANDLSIALGTSSAEAAEFLVQNLNAFGESSRQAQSYADTIATIRTSTSLDFQRMRDSFQYLAPISRILGEDLAYTGGIIGLLSDNGLKAENAARLLGTAQQKLAKEGKSLTDALNEINEAQSEGATGLELLSLASNSFGKQAAKVAVILATNQNKIEEYATSIRNSSGALDDLVNQQLQSLDAQIKILDSTWERLILTIENGNGAFSRFFKGATLGVTGFLEELIAVEESQSKVISAFDIGRLENIRALELQRESVRDTADEYNELTDEILKLQETLGQEPETSFFDDLKIGVNLVTGNIFDLQTEFDRLSLKQREFNETLKSLGSDTSLGFLKDQINALSKELRENGDLTENQRKLYFQQIQTIENLYNENRKYRNELEAQASEIVNVTGKFDEFGKKIDILTNEQLEDFIRKNKGLLKTLKDINEEFDENDFTSLDSLREKLKALRDAFGAADVESEQFQILKKEIAELEDEIARLEGKRRKKRTEENKKAIEGTIAYYDELIKQEKDFIQNTAKSTEEIKRAEQAIIQLNGQIDQLRDGLDKINKIELTIDPIGIQKTNNINDYRDRILKNLEGSGFDLQGPLDELERFNEARKNGEKAYTEFLKEEKEKQRDLSSRIFGELFGNFASYYNLDLSAFHDLLEGKKALEIDYAATISSISQSILQGKIANYDAEIRKNQETLDAILNDKNSSDKKKEQAQKEFDKREAELNKKKAQAQRDALLFQISIDTAQTVTKALLNAYALLSSPATAALASNAFAQAAIAGAFGAAQLAFVASKPLPEFFKGKDLRNNFEGLATWGEKRKEVKIGSDGNIEVSPNRTTPLFVKKDDIIVPSISKFHKEIENPNSDVAKRLAKKVNTDISENRRLFAITNNSGIDSKAIGQAVERAMMKYANQPHIWKGKVTVESKKPSRYHV